jgi:hypothetical protein
MIVSGWRSRDLRSEVRRRAVAAAWAALLAAGAACAKAAPPTAADAPQAVPDLRGQRVMLFPVQSFEGVGSEIDAELGFALTQRGADVDWIRADQMRRALATSPGLDVKLEGLPVGVFMQTEVRRVGDPLFGYLRRMGALVSSDVALVPVVARTARTPTPADGSPPRSMGPPPVIEIAAALLNVRNGQVLWFGVAAGSPGAPNDPRTLASAAEALGRRLLPLAGRTPQ